MQKNDQDNYEAKLTLTKKKQSSDAWPVDEWFDKGEANASMML